jgi:hypothetical protein
MLAIVLSRSALAAGEVVLEERPALAHDVPVALPADQAGGAGDDRVVADRDIGEHHQRTDDEDERHHADEQRPLVVQCCLAVDRFHEGHQLADEHRDHRVDQRHREAGDEHQRVPALRLADEVPVEREQSGRRRARPGGGRAADTGLEVPEHPGKRAEEAPGEV